MTEDDKTSRIVGALLRRQKQIYPILGFPLTSKNARRLDLSVGNVELKKFDKHEDYVRSLDHENFIWLGGYSEERNIYMGSELFSEEARCIHLGVDIALKPMTKLFLPIEGRIHSFQDNNRPFDYGPTIIVEHEIEDDLRFFTLFGHLSRTSLENLQVGKKLQSGQLIGFVGDKEENGQWNPHLHFQLITDMGNMFGDYPGVASKANAKELLHKCPDPQLILGFPDEPMIF